MHDDLESIRRKLCGEVRTDEIDKAISGVYDAMTAVINALGDVEFPSAPEAGYYGEASGRVHY
jgi:hypothetical protein